MTGEQYRNAIDHLGMTQVGSARFFDVSASTARKWIGEKHPIPAAVSMLLTVMMHYSLTPQNVIALEDRVASP